ncbi:hypothetical protein ACWC10_06260 [Streptomyces sp. NPDC001595]|uniref:hypothetical protein n=1 Tax=Streptomyces sp. NPDC001532 TaxID=3154520 RepID=UPI00332FC270
MFLPRSRPVAVEHDGAYRQRDAVERDKDKTADLTSSDHPFGQGMDYAATA